MAQKESLEGFLSKLQGRLVDEASVLSQDTPVVDTQLEYFSAAAPNAIEWATGPSFLNVESIYRHTRQYQIIRDLFQLRCPLPTCNDQSANAKDCWGKGKEYLQSENLLVWSEKYKQDVCPSCNTTRREFLDDGLIQLYNQLHVIAGMRSGKSSTASVIGTYIEHRMINIGHSSVGGLSAFFGQLPKQPFELTFIASTDVQAADTIWTLFTNLRLNSPWVQAYIKWIKQKELEQDSKNGARPWVYEERGKYIVNGFLNLKLNSLNSNSAGLAGRTRIAAFIDELSRFENTESARSADEAYRVLENSLRTLRSVTVDRDDIPWLGTMISISSPISENDKAMRLLKQAPNIKGMYYGHYATWEFNPEQPRKNFDDDFEKDPIGAMRDFGARPPMAASPLIQDPARFRELAIQKDLKATARFRQIVHTDRTNREYISLVTENANLSRNGERYICYDAGASFDQFAGACAHGEWIYTPEGRSLVTVFDWVFRLLPESTPRRDVWFDLVTQMIEHLQKYCFIARVEFDRWQSTYLIQQIRNMGINCEMQGTTADQFMKFINDVNYSKVRMLPPAPDDAQVDPPLMSAPGLAFYELEHLERSPDLKKVTNPRKGTRRGWDSDDVATVVAHVSSMVQGAAVDVTNSNSPPTRLRRETAGGLQAEWGTLFRSRYNRRGW